MTRWIGNINIEVNLLVVSPTSHHPTPSEIILYNPHAADFAVNRFQTQVKYKSSEITTDGGRRPLSLLPAVSWARVCSFLLRLCGVDQSTQTEATFGPDLDVIVYCGGGTAGPTGLAVGVGRLSECRPNHPTVAVRQRVWPVG